MGEERLYRCSQVFDGVSDGYSERVDIAVSGNRITSMKTEGTESGARVADLTGLTVLPGLIDAHSHLAWMNVDGTVSAAVMASQIFENCELAIDAGYTTLRDVGGVDGGLVSAIDRGHVRGPRVLPSGPILCQLGGHGDFSSRFSEARATPDIPGLARFVEVCDGADEMRRAVRKAFKFGASQIKVMVSGGVVSRTDNVTDTQFGLDELRVAVGEAKARGSYVTAHAHNCDSVRLGLAAGIRCFEHATFLDEETAMELGKANAWIVPTFSVNRLALTRWREWGIDEEMLPRFSGCEDAMARSMELAERHGVKIGLGSDILGPAQRGRGVEITIRAELAGSVPAMVSATSTNAELIGRKDLGVLAPGKAADFIAMDGDPVADPSLFSDPSKVVLVVRGGVIVKDTR